MTTSVNTVPTEDSVLNSIKQMLGGIDATVHDFDTDIIIHINTAIAILKQLGVGNGGFIVTSETDLWEDYLNEDEDLEPVKTYIYLKVKMVFDPPSSSILTDSYKRQIDELEWRLNVTADQEV